MEKRICKIQHPFMIDNNNDNNKQNTLTKVDRKGNYHNRIKPINDQWTTKITSNKKKRESLLTKIWNEPRMLTLIISIPHWIGHSSHNNLTGKTKISILEEKK